MCDEIDEEIIMSTNNNFTNKILTRLRNNRAYKYVGIINKALQKIYKEFVYNIQKSSLQSHKAYIALLAIFMQK